jgi:hypothetical protein
MIRSVKKEKMEVIGLFRFQLTQALLPLVSLLRGASDLSSNDF